MVQSRATVLRNLKKPSYGAGWWSKIKKKAKKHFKKHVTKAKKWGKKALAEGKKHAMAAAKAAMEEAKREAKAALEETATEAAQALHAHVSKTVCSAVGSGFAKAHGREVKKLLHREFDKVHVKALAHARTGKAGGALNDHVDKATKRVEAGVNKLKNKAKSRIRELAGCDEAEEGGGMRVRGGGMRVRGAGFGPRSTTGFQSQSIVSRARLKKMLKRGGGMRVRGAGIRGVAGMRVRKNKR